MIVEFRMLGAIDLRAEGRERDCAAVLAQPKRVALLVYLALAQPRGLQPRDAVLALFWPECSDAKARRSLNQALYFLRRHLGPSFIASEGDRIGIAPDALVCDAVRVHDHLDRGERREALELYVGELLPAFFPSESARLERWLDGERARIHARTCAAAVALADEHETRSEWLEAVHWLRRARELDPYDERLATRLIRRLASLGDRGGALRELESFARRLVDDLRMRPSADLETLGDELRTGPAVTVAACEEPAIATLETRPEGVAGRDDRPDRDEEPIESDEPIPARTVVGARTSTWQRPLAGALLLGAAIVAGIRLFLQDADAPQALDGRRVLVSAFVNETDDPRLASLGWVAADWVGQELAASGLVSSVPSAAVSRDVLPLRGRAAGRQGKEALALAARMGAGLLVSGAYYARGDSSIQFHARVVDVTTGDLVRAVEGPVVPRRSALVGIDRVRERLLGAFSTAIDPRLESWSDASSQPPNLEAYSAYAEGLSEFFADRPEEALRLFLQAATGDSLFTAPLLWAVRVRLDWDRYGQADSLLVVLESRRGLLRPWDRAMLDYFVARRRGTWEETREAAGRLVTLAPASEWLVWLAEASLNTNRPREALQAHDRLGPHLGWLRDWPYHWRLRADARHALGQFEEELEEVDLWRDVLPRQVARVRLRALAGLGRWDDHTDALASALDGLDPLDRAHLLLDVADEALAHGHDDRARELRERAATLARSLSLSDTAEDRFPRLGPLLYRAGVLDEARRIYSTDERLNPDAARVRLGRIAALNGDREEALRVDRWLASALTSRSRGWATMERAIIQALLDERQTALRLLARAMVEGHGFYPWLHTAPELQSLRGWEPFEDFMRPRG